jgi:hypothetical protein
MSNQDVLFDIVTKMEKQDYRNFSYMIAFSKKEQTIALIALLAAAGGGLDAMMGGSFVLPRFLVIWLILIVTAFAAIFLRTEYKAFTRSNEVRLGIKGGKQRLTFYENYLIAAQDNVPGSNKIKYEKLFQVKETKDYYIIYANANAASMLRKIDIDEEERDDFRKFLKSKMGTRYSDMTQNKKA